MHFEYICEAVTQVGLPGSVCAEDQRARKWTFG